MAQQPNNVPSAIAVPSGAPTDAFGLAHYLTNLGLQLGNWIAQAANAINWLLSAAQTAAQVNTTVNTAVTIANQQLTQNFTVADTQAEQAINASLVQNVKTLNSTIASVNASTVATLTNEINALSSVVVQDVNQIEIQIAGLLNGQTPPGGISVGLSGGATGLTVTGSPVTSSGTMVLGGFMTVPIGPVVIWTGNVDVYLSP